MSYRFYVIDHYTGKTWGTNDGGLAKKFSTDTDYYVLDAKEALLIREGEEENIKDLEEIRA